MKKFKESRINDIPIGTKFLIINIDEIPRWFVKVGTTWIDEVEGSINAIGSDYEVDYVPASTIIYIEGRHNSVVPPNIFAE